MTQTVKNYEPTEAMLSNSLRGNALNSKFNRSLVTTKLTKSMTLDEVKKTYGKLISLEEQYDPLERKNDGGPSDVAIEYLSNGAGSGLAWCRQILKSEGILKSYKRDIKDEEMNTEEVLKGLHLPIEKGMSEELKQVTYVAMVPDHTDLHGDFTSADEVRKAMESFNRSHQRANLFHRVMTDTFDVVESYIAPTDFIINEIPVVKGTWLMTLQVYDDDVWSLIKSGDINGISIGAMAKVETLEDEDEDDE